MCWVHDVQWIWAMVSLRSFLGLACYYCKFIKNFVKITTFLTNLLKQSSETYEWMKYAMKPLKPRKTFWWKHVLKLPNFDKDFEIHFDASWCTPKLLDGLNYKPNGEDNGRKRSWGTLTSSQHFGGREAYWSSKMGLRRTTSSSIIHTDLHRPNNKLVSA